MKVCLKQGSRSPLIKNIAVALAFTIALQSSGTQAHGQQGSPQSIDAGNSEYYAFDEAQSNVEAPLESPNHTLDISPLNGLSFSAVTSYAHALALSLLRWTLHSETGVQPLVKYDRRFHFGGWINDPQDETCYNTRAKVLIRDSADRVSFKERNHCLVDKGGWADPYAGASLTESRDVQIDHMVPLKNAYISGAWEWNFNTRCTYANFLGNRFHLISASAHENMSKGDKAPDKYMPPNESYRCQYLENWLKIKMIWKLKMSHLEIEAIQTGIKTNACDSRKFSLSAAELNRQRKLIYENNDLCPAH